MRAWELTLLIIALELSIGIVDAMTVTNHNYMMSDQYAENKYTLSASEDLLSHDDASVTDYYDTSVTDPFSAWNWFTSITTALVCMYPILVDKFHCPEIIAGALQAMIYLYMGLALYQWLSNRSESIMT